jgi:hypothetical protein
VKKGASVGVRIEANESVHRNEGEQQGQPHRTGSERGDLDFSGRYKSRDCYRTCKHGHAQPNQSVIPVKRVQRQPELEVNDALAKADEIHVDPLFVWERHGQNVPGGLAAGGSSMQRGGRRRYSTLRLRG